MVAFVRTEINGSSNKPYDSISMVDTKRGGRLGWHGHGLGNKKGNAPYKKFTEITRVLSVPNYAEHSSTCLQLYFWRLWAQSQLRG